MGYIPQNTVSDLSDATARTEYALKYAYPSADQTPVLADSQNIASVNRSETSASKILDKIAATFFDVGQKIQGAATAASQADSPAPMPEHKSTGVSLNHPVMLVLLGLAIAYFALR